MNFNYFTQIYYLFADCHKVSLAHTKVLHFFLKFYLFEREHDSTSRGSSRGRGSSRLPAEQGATCRAESQDLGIMT